MKVGQLMLFQNSDAMMQSDLEMYQNELDIAVMSESVGLDSVWAVEHHFTDYTLCPNIPMFLSYMAGKTKNISLGTAAIIMPWHKDPIRIATDMAMLDNMSDGRAMLGVGRGLAQVEYDGFGIDMGESRGRMNESLDMVLPALESGVMEDHDGEFFKQIRREIRPRPFKSFKDRLFFVSMSPDTIPHAARHGGQLMSFALGPWEKRAKDIDIWRNLYQEEHGTAAPKPSANLFCICDDDPGRATENAAIYMSSYFKSAIQHYDMDKDHFADKGKGTYDFYAGSAKVMAEMGPDAVGANFKDLQIYGTPRKCLEQIEAIQDTIGPFDMNLSFSFAGMKYDYAKSSLQMFAERCLPTLKSWGEEAKAAE